MSDGSLNKNGWQYMPNIVSKDEVSKIIESINNIENLEPSVFDPNRGRVTCIYAPTESAFLMKKIHPLMEDMVGEELYPSYWFCTVYYPGSFMIPHKDRFSCEVSVSINLQSTSTKWALELVDYKLEDQCLYTDVGCGVAYYGTALQHWRNPLQCNADEKHIQMFLHYVRKRGSFVSFAYDEGKTRRILEEVYDATEY